MQPWCAGFSRFKLVMPGLVPGIHVLASGRQEDVDGRDKSGHDVELRESGAGGMGNMQIFDAEAACWHLLDSP
jgi:hypothetical protein